MKLRGSQSFGKKGSGLILGEYVGLGNAITHKFIPEKVIVNFHMLCMLIKYHIGRHIQSCLIITKKKKKERELAEELRDCG